MRDYGCSKQHAKEIIKTMDMLTFGCFQIMQKAAHAGKSGKVEAEHFFQITFPGLSEETKNKIIKHASRWI